MLATENNGSEKMATTQIASAAIAEMAKEATCFYSHNVGVTFKDNNPIATNAVLLDRLASMPADHITKENGLTTFPLDTQEFAHFMHLLYCHTGDKMKLKVEFDGIFPFDAPDETGTIQHFNCQLVSISEVEAD